MSNKGQLSINQQWVRISDRKYTRSRHAPLKLPGLGRSSLRLTYSPEKWILADTIDVQGLIQQQHDRGATGIEDQEHFGRQRLMSPAPLMMMSSMGLPVLDVQLAIVKVQGKCPPGSLAGRQSISSTLGLSTWAGLRVHG